MCGIGAVFHSPHAKEQLWKSLGKILHRGLSPFEMECGARYALGANRLPIVDRGQAVQPAKNEDGTLLCVFNGEIYNYLELKAQLEGKGHRFATSSDSEVLVHLYEEYGEKMLGLLDSEMYAFVIYDKATEAYFAARDPLGVKPLYVAQACGAVYFASEMKQLVQFSDISEVLPVLPGHYVKDGMARKYSELIGRKARVRQSPAEMAGKVRLLLHKAVRKRVQTDLPVAVFLSGGLDSTAVLALVRKYHGNVTALIAGRKNSTDLYHAKKYCEEFGVPYKTIEPPPEEELQAEIERTIYLTETFEPNVIRNSVISFYISKLGAGFRVILCGEGADELFAGYPEFERLDGKGVENLELELLADLHRTQCQRVDRTSMHFTEEVRMPFLDAGLVDYALRIPGSYKVRDGISKWILRKAMEAELPAYICWRRKIVLVEGAGYKGNDPRVGMFDTFINSKMSDKEFESVTSGFPDWNIRTKEEAYYFLIFRKFKYDKGRFAQARPRVNRIRSLNEDALQALKSRRFNRYKPYRIEEADTHRLKFVMLWGALGKAMADGRDIEAVDFLKAFLAGVETAASIKSGITVLLADSHAKMNAINPLAAYTYLQNVKELLERNGFKTVYLSCLWKKWELEPEEIRQRAAAVKPANSALSEQLKRSSRRHYNGNPEEGGMIYYAMRLLEKQHLEREFEGSIFLTYNAPLLREILPDMPTLHLRSKKGSSEPPWLPAR